MNRWKQQESETEVRLCESQTDFLEMFSYLTHVWWVGADRGRNHRNLWAKELDHLVTETEVNTETTAFCCLFQLFCIVMLLYMDTLKCSTEYHTLDTTAKLELGLGNVGKIIQTKNVRVCPFIVGVRTLLVCQCGWSLSPYLHALIKTSELQFWQHSNQVPSWDPTPIQQTSMF